MRATGRGQRDADAEEGWRLFPEFLSPVIKPLSPMAKDLALSSVGDAYPSSAEGS